MSGRFFIAAGRLGGAVLSLALCGIAHADFEQLQRTVQEVEASLDARVGVLVLDTASQRRWAHRANERFLMNSTVKVLICAAVLDAEDAGTLTLDEPLPVREADLLAHAPMAAQRVGGSVPVAELCNAAVDLSDNTAANLLIERLGGPPAVTAFLRRIGDPVTRLDRMEPALNVWAEGDPRDTTTPTAIVATLEALLLGDALSADSRARLANWMRRGTYTGAFLRATAPAAWALADKSGAGDVTRTLIAMVTPADRAPWFVAVFISEAEVDFARRNAALSAISAAVVKALHDER